MARAAKAVVEVKCMIGGEGVVWIIGLFYCTNGFSVLAVIWLKGQVVMQCGAVI